MLIKGKQIAPQYAPSNFTPTGTDLDAYLQGIDNALGGGGSNIFGTEYQLQENNTPQSTTSTTFQIYDTLTIPADTLDPAGLYRLAVGWIITASTSNTEVASRFVVNGTPSQSVVIEPRAGVSLVPLYVFDTFSGLINVGTILTVELDFARNSGTGSAGIDSSAFELWRVQ